VISEVSPTELVKCSRENRHDKGGDILQNFMTRVRLYINNVYCIFCGLSK